MEHSKRKITKHYLTGLLACLFLCGCNPTSGQIGNERLSSQSDQQPLSELSEILGIDAEAIMCRGGRATIKSTSIITQAQVNQATVIPAPQNSASKMIDHSHIPVAVPKGAPTPRLSIFLTKDVMSGYNLSIKTENYELMPPPFQGQTMGTLMKPVIDSNTGYVQGHAHLYINSVKIQRVYGDNVHIPESLFRNGMNQLNVTINNHAHMFWTSDEKKIISSIFINTNTPQLVLHEFHSFPVKAKIDE